MSDIVKGNGQHLEWSGDPTWLIRRVPDRAVVQLANGEPFVDGIQITRQEAGAPMITLTLVVEDGQPILESIFFRRSGKSQNPDDPTPRIKASDIHDVALERLVRSAIRAVVQTLASEMGMEDAGAVAESVLGTRRRRRLTDALLEEVAAAASANPDTPTQSVSVELGTSHRNATRWIAEAKRRGFITEEEA